MSWDQYLENLCSRTESPTGKHCTKACIIGLDGGAKWTTNNHANSLKISEAESVTASKNFANGDAGFSTCGIVVEDVKYQFLRSIDGETFLFKKGGHGALSMQASKTAIIIAFTPEGCQQGSTNTALDAVVKYLDSIGY